MASKPTWTPTRPGYEPVGDRLISLANFIQNPWSGFSASFVLGVADGRAGERLLHLRGLCLILIGAVGG